MSNSSQHLRERVWKEMLRHTMLGCHISSRTLPPHAVQQAAPTAIFGQNLVLWDIQFDKPLQKSERNIDCHRFLTDITRSSALGLFPYEDIE